ncbi:trimeric intracellular cation channel family protein [Antribacter gilvus]|uniref:trimeric intracellular cation channel family protein n=1 Tax=Antribacter gilvus TaxID=2304675 RepID=UPI001F0C6A43|nr:trimeric intracellular cation channel family protein [Antribacter gilvus]
MAIDSVLEIIGVFFAALSGGLAAVRKSFDVFGVVVLAWAAGLGGGILRDVLIGDTPPVGISDPRLVGTALLAGVVIFFLHPGLARMRPAVVALDAGALAFFVLQGTTKGLEHGAGLLASVVVGVLTGIGGGVLRDMLVGEIPLVFADRQLYAIPAVVGAGLTATLWHFDALTVLTQAGVVVVVLGFRLLSLWRGWVAPQASQGWTGRWGRFGSGRM